MKFVTQDYYEIMGVGPGATAEEVKRAYRLVKQSFRPDSMAIHSLYSAEETEAISAKIDEAFRLLSDPESARRYGKYHRTGRVGMNIPRDPDAFFDLVHDLDGRSPIEELAEQVGRSRQERIVSLDEHRPEARKAPDTSPLRLTRKAANLEATSAEVVAQAEVFIDSLEEVPGQGVLAAPSEHLAPAASVMPEMIPSPAGPHLGRSRQPDLPLQPQARLDPSTRPLPGSEMRPSQATTLARTPAVAAAPKHSDPARRWHRETVRTRAVGALDVQPLPREELEALEVDCGGINGEYLRQVRRGLEISLQDIADRTKIGIAMLRYMEADEIGRLPARVYLKGYLNQVCRLLRLPTPQMPEKYLAGHGL